LKRKNNSGLSTDEIPHKSVMVAEVLEYLALRKNGVYLDVTFGAGGHTRAILQAEPSATIMALDWDAQALEKYSAPLVAEFGERIIPVWGNFALLYKIIKEQPYTSFDGILADFGTSQVQIAYRKGFSIYKDTPLDMRMSPSHQKVTAEQVVNKSSAIKLQEIFFQLGDERHSRDIAQAIVQERLKNPIKTTFQLAQLIENIVGKKGGRAIHPATRVFQALRIFVNHELNNIESFLPVAIDLLNPNGRLVCISFHSLEDRIVKQCFKDYATKGVVDLVTKRVVKASEQEVRENRSARSACLRAVKKNITDDE
jgi:16S rRNA (cytosine1402-N4)-methyltransferase